MNHHLRTGMSALALGSTLLLAGACSKSAEPVQTSATAVAVTSPTKESVTTPTTEDVSGTEVPTTQKKGATTTTEKGAPTTKPGKSTTTAAKTATGPEFAAEAVTAFQTKLGDFKALEMVLHVDNGNAYVQAQDPAKPANVDQYDYRKGSIDGPTPVKLTGDGDLASNLFGVQEVVWDKLPAMMEQAKTSIGELEGSKGVTHLIIKKNLPFDSDTVVNIYVEGGTRKSGGYVSFKGDGTLKKVYGPS